MRDLFDKIKNFADSSNSKNTNTAVQLASSVKPIALTKQSIISAFNNFEKNIYNNEQLGFRLNYLNTIDDKGTIKTPNIEEEAKQLAIVAKQLRSFLKKELINPIMGKSTQKRQPGS